MAAGVVGGWLVVALVFSGQGYLFSLYAGRAQAWWPSLGYSLAIFSIWAVITWPLMLFVRRVEAWGAPLPSRLAVYALGLVVVAALHVGLFALVYWPIYNDGGRIPTRWAMGARMFISNAHTNAVFYVAIAVATARVAASSREKAAARTRPVGDGLRVRRRGRVQVAPLSDVEWIGAAGNYAEAHTGERAFLVDESLSALATRLPADTFVRIHRGAIVRLDRIAEVRGAGRGDAWVTLCGGQTLRLSRRYRSGLADWLAGA